MATKDLERSHYLLLASGIIVGILIGAALFNYLHKAQLVEIIELKRDFHLTLHAIENKNEYFMDENDWEEQMDDWLHTLYERYPSLDPKNRNP